MRPSRGMGAVRASKMPGGKKITRKDDPNEVMTYAKGGKVKESDEDDKTQDKAMVKKAFKQHESAAHGGKHVELKLKKGGKAKKPAEMSSRDRFMAMIKGRNKK